MEGCPGVVLAVGLGVNFLAAKIVGEVDAVEADPIKGTGVELGLWLWPGPWISGSFGRSPVLWAKPWR
jgi:hypothetical protein